MEWKRKTNEDIRDYKVRLAINKDIYGLTWLEICDILNEETGDSYGESAYRKELTNFVKGMNFQIEKSLDEEHEDKVKEINDKIREMKKEKIKIQQINNEYNKTLRNVAKGELFEELIVSAIREYVEPLNIPEPKAIHHSNKEGVLLIADSHYGKEFTIKSITGEVINEYSVDIFKQRMNKLLDETVDIIRKEGLQKIHIFNLGDSIEGIIRFKKTLPETGILTAIMEYIAFMRSWLNKLSEYVNIEYYQNLGNHSSWRILDSKDHRDTFPQENAERLVVWSLREMLKDNHNIKLHDEQVRGLVYADVLGYKFVASHGEKIKNLENAIKDYSALYEIDIDYLLLGHKHFNLSSVATHNGKEVIQCASLMGVDEYAIELKKSSQAGCRMLIIESDKGKTVDYSIKLN